MNQFEKPFWDQNELVIGLDEAGRGPLAGELVVAGVVLPIGYKNDAINDSKKITERRRDLLYEVILEEALFYQIEIVSLEEIDSLNIYHATRIAMERIVSNLNINHVLTDAMPLQLSNYDIQDIVKGDQKSISIAAASILAKVTRDRMMLDYDQQFPEYGFAKHKGYPTKEHLQKILEHGICPIHRLSFGPVRQVAFDLGILD